MSSVAFAPARTPRVAVVGERLIGALDEGRRKFARALAEALEHFCEVRTISVGGDGGSSSMVRVPGSRTLANLATRKAVRDTRPDIVCYTPEASLTVFALARARMLKLAVPEALVVVLAVQPRKLGSFGRMFASRLRPDAVLGLSNATIGIAQTLGMQSGLLSPAVDLDVFRPAGSAVKAALRVKFGLPADEFVVLHVGHAKRERGVEVLKTLTSSATVVFVAAASEGRDEGLADDLRNGGVVVIDEYEPAIHELYQAADCYVFPVVDPDAAIGAPLSVLEAMASNLPVVTTRHGVLPNLFDVGPGYRYAASPSDIAAIVKDRAWESCVQTRAMVSPYTWDNTAREFLQIVGIPI